VEIKITGIVRDSSSNPIAGVSVEAYDSDVGADDYLGITKTNNSGSFELSFSEDSFKEILERNPDVYLIVRDDFGILHKTEIKSETKNGDTFDITLSESKPVVDIYSNGYQRVISQFMAIGDSVDLSQADTQMLMTQMIRSLSSWLYYTNPKVMHQYGYPGPQVPRYPKKQSDHIHSLPWHQW
jgi:hypothetical protein